MKISGWLRIFYKIFMEYYEDQLNWMIWTFLMRHKYPVSLFQSHSEKYDNFDFRWKLYLIYTYNIAINDDHTIITLITWHHFLRKHANFFLKYSSKEISLCNFFLKIHFEIASLKNNCEWHNKSVLSILFFMCE